MSLAFAPHPVTDDWRDAAECAVYPVDLWADGRHARAARAVCTTCPVNDACLLEALTIEANGGNDQYRYRVWGGLTGRQRRGVGLPWPSLRASAANQIREVRGGR